MAQAGKSKARPARTLKAADPPWISTGTTFPAPPPGGVAAGPAFPILTEEIGYPPVPLVNTGSGSPASSQNGGVTSLGPTVTKALQDVLGWKLKRDDPQGFVGALTQSFQLTTFEGHVESKWTPRSYAVQTDLAGGITGAQASLYTMAKTLLDQALPLIDGLYGLDPAVDAEYVAALKQLAANQLTELVGELSSVGGPRVARVHQYFRMLLGITLTIGGPQNAPVLDITSAERAVGEPEIPRRLLRDEHPWTDPDGVLGTLGNLRDELGLAGTASPGHPSYINTVDDEQNVTNFRILVDYTNSLLNSWQNSFRLFMGTTSAFLGTQLVLISRQLGVISESVDEVRFVLDSVFIGAGERATFLLQLRDPKAAGNLLQLQDPTAAGNLLPPIYLEDLLSWTQNFVTQEAPGIIQTGGKLGIGEDFANVILDLSTQVYATWVFAAGEKSSAISSNRVLDSVGKLARQLYDLYIAAFSVGVQFLPPRP